MPSISSKQPLQIILTSLAIPTENQRHPQKIFKLNLQIIKFIEEGDVYQKETYLRRHRSKIKKLTGCIKKRLVGSFIKSIGEGATAINKGSQSNEYRQSPSQSLSMI